MKTKFYAKKEVVDEILDTFPIEANIICLPNKHYQAEVLGETYEVEMEKNVIGGKIYNAKFIYSSEKENNFHSSVIVYGNIAIKEINS